MKRFSLVFCLVVAACVLLADVASTGGLPEGRWAHPSSAEDASSAAEREAVARTSPARERSSRRPAAPADSLRLSVAAGDVLVTTLPARLGEQPVSAYAMLRTPALSDLAGRSFFWRTRPRDAGRHRLTFRARFDTSAAGAALDTLAVLVDVQPAE